VPIHRYRSIEEMPPPWRDADDPENLRLVARLLAFHRRFDPSPTPPGVRRFRTLQELDRDSGNPYHQEQPGAES